MRLDVLVHWCVMKELSLPKLPEDLQEHLKVLHEQRKKYQAERRKKGTLPKRRHLSESGRKRVFDKTGDRCHLCGGKRTEVSKGELKEEREFVVDHIVPFASEGADSEVNFLAAHGLCNGARWFYSPEEFQWILRMGTWARKQMEDGKSDFSANMRQQFLKNEKNVIKRRKRNQEA
jgi:hypothetical protein